MSFTYWRYPMRRFEIDGERFAVRVLARSDGLESWLIREGREIANDKTPNFGPEAVRNHRLTAKLTDGRTLEVEAGYVSSINMGCVARVDDSIVYESHPGRVVVYPEKMRAQIAAIEAQGLGEGIVQAWKNDPAAQGQLDGYDLGAFKRNRIPLGVDIGLGLLFFVIAKLTDLTTAALIGAAIGLLLLVVQRITKVDLLGGLAMFGILLLLLSAGLALAFQSDEAVKYRTTVIGLISATLFLIDGLFRGNRLGRRMALYLPYHDIDPARLAIGMGLLGIVMASANQAVAMLTSTDFWLFYSTFADFVLAMVLILFVFRYSRGELARDVWPSYSPPKPVVEKTEGPTIEG